MTRSLTTLLFICLSVLPLALSPDVHSGEIAPTQGTPGNQHESQSGGSRPDAQAAAFESSFLLYSISDSLDDGTEAQGTWYPKGYEYDLDRVGTESSGERFIAAFRFKVPDLVQGEQVAFARLRLPSREQISHGTLHLVVGGVDEDSPEPCSQVRLPSQIPETDEAVPWHVRALPRSVSRFFYQTSPNLAPVLNEILARPGWSRAGKALILVVEPDTTSRQASGYIGLQDCVDNTRRRTPAMLEIYPTVEDALVGKPVLGRPTDTSVTINLLSLIDLDVYVRYGTAPGDYAFSTKTKSGQAGGEAIEIELTGLMPNATYFYRVFYRPSGEGDFRTAPEAAAVVGRD